MNTTEATAVTINDEALKAETERLILLAAERNGISPDVIREQVKEQAVEQARKNLTDSAKEDGANAWKSMYEAERQRRETTEAQLSAVRDQKAKSGTNGPNPHVVLERAKASVGLHQWNQRMTSDQKLVAVGIPPSSVDVKEARKVFGKGADQKLGIDLMKSSPERYRTLKLAALATGVYGG